MSKTLVVTGAGISIASGIPAFRTGPNAVWSEETVTYGRYEYFKNNPVKSWQWYLSRFEGEYTPNSVHTALAGMNIDVVTQNIDGLHLKAGQKSLIEVHGAARFVRCTKHKCRYGGKKGVLSYCTSDFDAFKVSGAYRDLPTCPIHKNVVLRPHVLWFDELYNSHKLYKIQEVKWKVQNADSIVFIGTSFSVGITQIISEMADIIGVPMWSIDPYKRPPMRNINWVPLTAEEYFTEYDSLPE